MLAQDGIVLAAERKVTSKLLEQDTSAEKLYILNEYVSSLPSSLYFRLLSLRIRRTTVANTLFSAT